MERKTDRKSWTRPTITPVGNVAEVIRGGGGKLTIQLNDVGDVNKPKGQEGG